jgi:hypothetical protein
MTSLPRQSRTSHDCLGCDVQTRDIALAPATEPNRCLGVQDQNRGERLERRMRDMSHGGIAARAIAKAILGLEPSKEIAVTAMFDSAA